ncbi:thioredoxin domain-containing protein [Arachidicoccus sp.]|uniref:thioredoxin domain-containing protein n=1 Tax=Arachidicoccus sp. TaxID=1872624 RepID=UPI003D227516
MANLLINETSPYLLQHAENPVQWHPWGDEALKKAKSEDKLILVSIGYSACHWCHVMERESFENEATAKLMNKYFINIKVDREERPDIDHIYMDAVQAMSGQGGWPLNVFLTPDAKPFYGGTYFPPKPYANRPSWTDILTNVYKAFSEKKEDILAQADNLIAHLQNANNIGSRNSENNFLTKENIQLATENLLKQADGVWGGFGKAPKFPQSFSIQFLLRQFYFTKNEQAKQQALLSLDKMIQGGIYDQIGGGFARYSTDEKWLAPHFEKMLYDNALLISTISEAYQLTKKRTYKNTIEQTISFLERELMHETGGWYAALDADSEGMEGKFYTWQKEEIESILADKAEIFCLVYDVETKGNWEDANILWLPQTIEEVAAPLKINPQELEHVLKTCREKLLTERNKRIRPALDDKIILGWNAMGITALCKAFNALGNKHYLQLAENCFSFLEKNMFDTTNKKWQHTWKNKEAKFNAFIDDYAILIQSCIHLQEATGNFTYLEKAASITEYVLNNFSDENETLFYFTEKNQADIVVRKKEIYDGAIPSGNAVMAENLQYLSIILNKPEWNERALSMLQSLGNTITRYPTSFGIWCGLLQKYIFGINEIAIVGNQSKSNAHQFSREFIPNKILQFSEKENTDYPLISNKNILVGKTLFYLCKDYSCKQPVETLEDFLQLLIK